MYKLISIDLDGTLLNSKGYISEKNKEVLNKLIKKNVEVIINSGRQIATTKRFAEKIGNINYCICGNGAIIYDIKNNKKIYSNFLQKSDVLKIIEFCKENDIYFNVYTEDIILVESFKHNILTFYKQNKGLSSDIQINIVKKNDVYKYISENDVNVLKIGISHCNKNIFDKIFKARNQFKSIDFLEVEGISRRILKEDDNEKTIEYFYTEATKCNSNKGEALKKLIEYLKINPKDVVAIGDNINDRSMIENAGLGIAMGNSIPKITEVANATTLSNDNDGVAYAINKYIINNE